MNVTGFLGLGNMGSVLAANLLAAGHDVIAFDIAGAGRLPAGAAWAGSVRDVARRAPIIVASLPGPAAAHAVAAEIRSAAGEAGDELPAKLLIDTSTIGITAAREIAELLAGCGIGYVDSPVSGGVAGARARTLTVMYAGSEEDCAAALPVIEGLSDRRHRVGEVPGLGQAMKLANNFLSATALAATSEAISFGLDAGLDLATMLEVLNASSGGSRATSEKFPQQVQTGKYAAGFTSTLMAKDVRLYVESARTLRSPAEVSEAIEALWSRFAAAEPGVDFTRVFPYIQGAGGQPAE